MKKLVSRTVDGVEVHDVGITALRSFIRSGRLETSIAVLHKTDCFHIHHVNLNVVPKVGDLLIVECGSMFGDWDRDYPAFPILVEIHRGCNDCMGLWTCKGASHYDDVLKTAVTYAYRMWSAAHNLAFDPAWRYSRIGHDYEVWHVVDDAPAYDADLLTDVIKSVAVDVTMYDADLLTDEDWELGCFDHAAVCRG